ncbi:hypothetical protein [Methanosarcina barkeri]|uniref:hypothetical protein n=1 Tax=Methanosarcina barkeri TaxID=2208 RepID=UPI00064FE58D|nr:hypothetical protein [Methanosarcina barkeri]
MKESKVFLFMAYFTMLILFSIIPKVSFATKDSSERGKDNQSKYISEGVRNLSNHYTGDAGDSAIDKERLQVNFSVKDRNRNSDYKQEKKSNN